jgi:hypothetical protein
MRSTRRILSAGALAGAAMVAVLGAPASASAKAGADGVAASGAIHYNIVKGATSYGCYAAMDAEKSKGFWYVRGRYYRYPKSSTCYFALVRQRHGHRYSWHYSDNGQNVWVYGGWHKDTGYKAWSCATTDTLSTKCTKSW